MNKIIDELSALEYFGLDDIDRIMNEVSFEYEDYKREYGFITSEEADDMVRLESNISSLDRMACFLAKVDRLNQDYYYINGYENLENVTQEILECFRSDLITELSKA